MSSLISRPITDDVPTMPAGDSRLTNRYGRFAADGSEYIINDPRTPRPWTNIIANERVGLAISQSGSGFSWIDNSQLAVLTRWGQDFAEDTSGKFLYLRDVGMGETWSLAPAPCWAPLDHYACRHTFGSTTFEALKAGVRSAWTLLVPPADTVELWRVELTNTTERPRRLELTAFVEWNCGVLPSPRREFHKLFIETRFDAERGVVYARNHMWDVSSKRWGHWNTSFPYVTAFACTEPLAAAQGDKTAFTGRNGSMRAPAAIESAAWAPRFGRHDDPIAATRCVVELAPGETRVIGYVMATDADQAGADRLLTQYRRVEAIAASADAATAMWRDLLSGHRIDTPETSLNFCVNDWVRYQAISARLWGRAGYYQQSGAFGFRDQLQDSQVWLTIDPLRCRRQLNLHAAHQFADGSVQHWWHPLSEQGHVTRMTDDLLWLSFVTANYIKETDDLGVLDDAQPFLDEAAPAPLREHIRRAFERVFQRTSPRGLPYIGAGDWNDGLSAVGLLEKGESFWLGEFLAGLLRDWAVIYRRIGDNARAVDFDARRARLVDAINTHAWDGAWYARGTLDDGRVFGSAQNRVGRIFLNAQTWAILNDVATPERAARCWAAVREHLVREVGALLLAPAYDEPDETVGYITRYAPGLRENGGVYTHAATWAIAAACKMKDAQAVAALLEAINPALKDPDRYWAEPYVLPGNVDGPQSPYFGRGGWTWYTGSAQWLHRIVSERVLGVRADWDGLRVDPCLPPAWREATMERPYRGATYRFSFSRDARVAHGSMQLTLDGERLAGDLLPAAVRRGAAYQVDVVLPE